MRAGRIVALVLGVLLLFPVGLVLAGIGLLVAGGSSEDRGVVTHDLERLETETFAVTAPLDRLVDVTDTPQWVLDRLDVDVEVAVTGVAPTRDVFVGIADSDDVAAYLQGAAHAEITDVDGSRVTTRVVGAGGGRGASIQAPTEAGIWTSFDSGPGTRTIRWSLSNEARTVVVMNADGDAGVRADPALRVRLGFLTPLGVTVLVTGLVLALVALVLIVLVGVRGHRRDRARAASGPPPTDIPPGPPPYGRPPRPPYGPPVYGPPVGQQSAPYSQPTPGPPWPYGQPAPPYGGPVPPPGGPPVAAGDAPAEPSPR